jgi:WD40 repeat protein
MDIDQNGSAQITPSLRGESEVVVSDADSPSVVEEIPFSTLSIGQSTFIQTEELPPWENGDSAHRTLESGNPPRRELDASHTTKVLVKEPNKDVTHTLWAPTASSLLLTGGKSLARLHNIPDLRCLDFQISLHDFMVTAVCFTSNGEAVVAAREEHVNEQGETMNTNRLVKIVDAGQDSQIISSLVGLVTTLRWNPSSRTLLSVSTTDMAGSIKIWTNDDTSPAFTAFADSAIIDAAWMTETEFVVCGLDIVQVYQIDGELKLLHSFEKEGTWETVKYDPSHRIIVCAAFEEELLGVIYLNAISRGIQTIKHPDKFFSGLELSTLRQPAGDSGRDLCLVGTCAMAGAYIWDVGNPEDPFHEHDHFFVPINTQARCLAFSKSGNLIAVGTREAVSIWNILTGTYETKWLWEDGAGPEVEQEASLSWNHDDSRLAFSVGNQAWLLALSLS